MRRAAPAFFPPELFLLFLLLLASALPAAAQSNYICFGDSITFGFGDDQTRPTAERGYPGRLDNVLAARGFTATVVNEGLNSEATPEAVTRIEEVIARATAGSTLLLMEGTNDISVRTSIETIVFNLDAIADKAETAGLRVVHGTVVPRLSSANTDGNNRTAEQMSALLRESARTANRTLADPFEVFFHQTQNFPSLFVGGTDRLHPNAAGYDKLTEVWADQITSTDKVPPTVGLVSPANGSENTPADTTIRVSIHDFGRGIDVANARLTINGTDVPATVTGTAQRVQFDYRPTDPLRGVVSVGFRAQDTATPANTVTRTVSDFIIAGTTFLAGDIDRDGRVDGTDLVTFALVFGARRGEARYRAFADFDGSGAVDGLDLARLAANFGLRSF